MPFETADGAPADFRQGFGTTPGPEPSYGDLPGAALRQSNSLVSALYAVRNSGPFEPVDDYRAIDDIKDTPYFDNHASRFIGSRSPNETSAIKRQIDQEEHDQQTLSAAGGLGMLSSMVAGSLDPSLLLPGRVAFSLAKEGTAIVRGVKIAGAVTAETTAQEAALQSTQDTRTLGESVMNVGSATVLGAIMGGAAGLLSKGEHAALVTKMDRQRAEGDAHAAGLPEPTAPPAAAASPAMAASTGAAATDTRRLDLVPTGIGLEKLPTDPVIRTFQQPAISARRGMADLSELSLLTKENVAGQPTSNGPPLESIYRTQNLSSQVRIRDDLLEGWKDYRFDGNAPRFPILRDQIGLRSGQGPTFEEYKSLVSDAMMNGDKHGIPQVQKVAQQIREHFDHWSDRAAAAIPEFEKIEGEDYFPHAWNKPQIQAERPQFVNKLTAHYAADQAAKRSSQDRIGGLNDRLKEAQTRLDKLVGKADKADEFAAATADHDAIRKKIEDEIAKWDGKSTVEAKGAMKAREKYEAERQARAAAKGEAAPTERLRGADDAIDKAVKRILESDREKSLEDIRAKANETVDRILSSPDGRLPYDEGDGKPTYGPTPSGEPMRGGLASRLLNVSNDFARDWIERDVEKVFQNFNRTFMPDVLLAERFGDIGMSQTFRQINEEYAALIDASGPGKGPEQLGKLRDRTIADVAAIRDRFRGLYNVPTTNSQRNIARISGAVRNAMVPLNLGMAAASSIPDAAGKVFQWGMMSALQDAWVPFVKSLMTNREFSREAMREARVMGIATDTFTASRHHELAGIADGYHPQSPLERTLQWGADKFALVNGLAYWTDVMKTFSMLVNSANMYRAMKAAIEGKATKKQLTELGAANIPPNLYDKIVTQFEKSGKEIDGQMLPNTADWPRETREVFEAALSRNANINVSTPGLDKPLFMSDPTWAVLTQFKSFTAAAHNRILIANLQRADAQTLQGLVASLGLGMVAYKFNAIAGGSPTSDRPQDWIKEAMARGSIFGWLEEGNALTSKMTRGGLDIYRLIGSDHPLSKYAGRTVADQLLGPTFGKLIDLQKMTGAASSGQWDAGDVKAMRRFIPTQNLAYVRWLFNQMEAGATNAMGIQPKQ